MSSLQKKLAAKILKVGESRIWLDPTQAKDIKAAITKADVRKFIQKKAIKALPTKVKMPKEKKRKRKGIGSRKGAKHSRLASKKKWISAIRPLRRMLKELRSTKQIDKATYRKLYMLVKGGMFRNRSHLQIYLEQHGIIKKK